MSKNMIKKVVEKERFVILSEEEQKEREKFWKKDKAEKDKEAFERLGGISEAGSK